ncbi:hypothetical protein [Acinetobacter junii]|uniref:hypothetical protein n=1 Tax=Acinetobacter junii TaxID=40215 RepID=UPI001D1852CE|nr:hypothetical protein [Acinetobacter junii]
MSVLKLKHKLLSENSISTEQAARLLNCSVNWLGEYWCKSGFLTVENLVYWKLVQQKDVEEVLKLKESYMTGAEASKLLGMPHSHITNLHTQGLIQPIYLGTGTPIHCCPTNITRRTSIEVLLVFAIFYQAQRVTLKVSFQIN